MSRACLMWQTQYRNGKTMTERERDSGSLEETEAL